MISLPEKAARLKRNFAANRGTPEFYGINL
jgi:hypothetical protein